MSTTISDTQTTKTCYGGTSSEQTSPEKSVTETPPRRHADLSAWIVWAILMLTAIAILPFAVRNQEVVRAIARMCGFSFE